MTVISFGFIAIAIFFRYTGTTPIYVPDQCIDICRTAKLPPLDLDDYEQVVCQRGCRFFIIIKKLKFDVRINTTRKECWISCAESYLVKKENEICQIGCNKMGKIQERLVTKLLIDTENSIVLASPERDIEFDVLADPSIKNQLDIGFDVEYKIPETHIRTMPIEITQEVIQVRVEESGDWLDCAARNSGIPRWILLSAILAAVLIALWLSFSTDERSVQENVIVDIDSNGDKLLQENNDILMVKDPSLLNCGPILDVDGKYSCQQFPPKYTSEDEEK